MSIYYLRTEADQDLEEIRHYIAQDDLAAAIQFLPQIRDTFRQLADFPMMGTARPELGSEFRSLTVGDYLIFYRPVGDGADISRVLHSSQNIGSEYFDS